MPSLRYCFESRNTLGRPALYTSLLWPSPYLDVHYNGSAICARSAAAISTGELQHFHPGLAMKHPAFLKRLHTRDRVAASPWTVHTSVASLPGTTGPGPCPVPQGASDRDSLYQAEAAEGLVKAVEPSIVLAQKSSESRYNGKVACGDAENNKPAGRQSSVLPQETAMQRRFPHLQACFPLGCSAWFLFRTYGICVHALFLSVSGPIYEMVRKT